MEKQRHDQELQIAREIQRSLFPARLPEIPGFEVAADSRPCYEVGGDSYDWIDLGGGRLALVVADASGKGTPASLLMASVHAFVHARAGTDAPAQMMERLNRFLVARTQANQYVTLFYAELDATERRLAYVNAGHVPPYHVARDGTVRRLPGGGPPLGLLEGASYAEVRDEARAGGRRGHGHRRGDRGQLSRRVRVRQRSRLRDPARAVRGKRAAASSRASSQPSTTGRAPAGCSDDLTTLVLKVL